MNIRLLHNPQTGQYQAVDLAGNILAGFSSNLEGIRAALQWLLAREAPAILKRVEHCIQHHPTLTDRALRAGCLVADRTVQPECNECNRSCNLTNDAVAKCNPTCNRVRVHRQSDATQAHTVDLDALTCDCADFQSGLNGQPHGAPLMDGQPYCMHILAVLLAETMTKAKPKPTPAEQPATRRGQWDKFYRERELFQAKMRAVRAGVHLLM